MANTKDARVAASVSRRSIGTESSLESLCPWLQDPVLRRLQPRGMPQLFGNEDLEMGDSTIHTITMGILLYGLGFHLPARTGYRVFGNLNLYYSDDPTEYLSPDVMVVKPPRTLPAQLTSYRIGHDGPAPLFVGEVLSFRTWQQGDLARKPMIYSSIGVDEYLLTDVTGEMLSQQLLLLRRQRGGKWRAEQDDDAGVTSQLGFRVAIDADSQLRVIDSKAGKHYARPDEAQQMADRVRALEEECARLRQAASEKTKGKRRRRKP